MFHSFKEGSFTLISPLYTSLIEDPNWSDAVLGRDAWTIHDKQHGDWDGCYMAPYMHQVILYPV